MTGILTTSSGTDAVFAVVAPPVLGDDAISALAALLLDYAEAEQSNEAVEGTGDSSEVRGQ